MTDVDGNRYVDYIGSWGPMLFGHAHPDVVSAVKDAVDASTSFGAPTEIEIEVAELVCDLVPSVEKVRMVNSGTEATMSAARVARGYTGRDKIIKFAISLTELVKSNTANTTIKRPMAFSTLPKCLRNRAANCKKGFMKNAAITKGSVRPTPNTNSNPTPW